MALYILVPYENLYNCLITVTGQLPSCPTFAIPLLCFLLRSYPLSSCLMLVHHLELSEGHVSFTLHLYHLHWRFRHLPYHTNTSPSDPTPEDALCWSSGMGEGAVGEFGTINKPPFWWSFLLVAFCVCVFWALFGECDCATRGGIVCAQSSVRTRFSQILHSGKKKKEKKRFKKTTKI